MLRTGEKKYLLRTLFSLILGNLMKAKIWKRSIFTITNKSYTIYIIIFPQTRIAP